MEKVELNSEKFLRFVINYMLREFDADYESVKKKQMYGNTPWFQYYWDTPETKKQFLDWLREFIKATVNYKPNSIDDIVESIDLMWGLKVYEDESNIKK
jgi:hypothetical protein